MQAKEDYGIKFLISVVLIAFGNAVPLRADQLDEVIRDQMKKRVSRA